MPQDEKKGRKMDDTKGQESFAASLDRHVETEGRILEEYRALSEKIADGPVGMLVDLILTEEEQHHFLLRTMAKRLREPLRQRAEEELSWAVDRHEVARHAQKLRQHERETIAACRQLKNQLPAEDAEFFDAILDAIILDSEKHQRLLLAVDQIIVSGEHA